MKHKNSVFNNNEVQAEADAFYWVPVSLQHHLAQLVPVHPLSWYRPYSANLRGTRACLSSALTLVARLFNKVVLPICLH